MASVLIAALFAQLTAPGAAVSPPVLPSAQDVRCYRLMAALAEHEDPRIASAGLTGAQYFLGRIDGVTPDHDLADGEPLGEGEWAGLLERCGALMGIGGRDFRTLGQALTERRPVV